VSICLVSACASGQPRTFGSLSSIGADAELPDTAAALVYQREKTDACLTSAPVSGARIDAGTTAVIDDAAITEGAELAISDEPPYAPGARGRPKNALAASSEDDIIARWNRGGPSALPMPDAKPPHPAPRIKVDVIQVHGHVEEVDVLRVARSKGYWPFRLCYEEGLRRAPKLHGAVRFRVTVGPGGSPRGVRKVAAEVDDPVVVSCVLKAARNLVLAAPERGTPEVTLEVSLWPGDLPVRVAAESSLPPTVSATLMAALRARWPDVRACFAIGARRLPGLWGRLALRLRLAPNGQVTEAAEVESHFADADVTECVLRAYERTGVSSGEDRVIVYALRLGTPPSAAH
jgi:hypothetical protein